MNVNELTLTVQVRVLVNGAAVPLWRVRVLGLCARLLGIPLDVPREQVTVMPANTRAVDGREIVRAIEREVRQRGSQNQYLPFS